MEIVRQLLAIALVLGLLLATLWWLRRRNPAGLRFQVRKSRHARSLESLERLPLSSQHVLHLVRVADRVLVLAVHASGCSLLESFPWSELDRSEPRLEPIGEPVQGGRR